MLSLYILEKMYYDGINIQSAFLYGFKSIEEIQNQKIVIYGTAQNSWICTKVLNAKGLKVHAYCDNNDEAVKQKLVFEKIMSPYEAFKNKDFHYIIPLDRRHIIHTTLQLTAHKITNFSYFFICSMAYLENQEYQRMVLPSINILLYSLYPYQNSFDLEFWEDRFAKLGINRESFGIAETFLLSTNWWHKALEWICDDLTHRCDSMGEEALEIGPGNGLFSCIIKMIKPDLNIDWLEYSREEKAEETIYLDAINKEMPVNVYFGLIEDPNFKINKTYDIIVMTEVFEHFIAYPVDTLKRIASMLKPKGKLYLTTPDWEHIHIHESWKKMKKFNEIDEIEKYTYGHNYQYTKDEIFEIFELAELKVNHYELSLGKNHNVELQKNKE